MEGVLVPVDWRAQGLHKELDNEIQGTKLLE
jgi:hypothetical protein